MAFVQPTFTNGINNVPYIGSSAFIDGYELNITGDKTFTLKVGSARAYNKDAIISYPLGLANLPGFIPIDISILGAMGSYPISMEASFIKVPRNTNFGVYVLGDSISGNPTVAIVATDNNFLLPGYDLWRRVGTIYVDTITGNIISMIQNGSGNDRTYTLENGILLVLNSSNTLSTFVDMSASNLPCNPNITTNFSLNLRHIPASLTQVGLLTTTETGGGATPGFIIQSPVDGQAVASHYEMPANVINQSIGFYYRNSAASGSFTITLAGWSESLGLQAI